MREPEEWEKRFGRERVTDVGPVDDRFRIEFSVESYMENHANKFSGTFDANCYLYLSRASDLFSLAEHGGSLEAGFRRLKLKLTVQSEQKGTVVTTNLIERQDLF